MYALTNRTVTPKTLKHHEHPRSRTTTLQYVPRDTPLRIIIFTNQFSTTSCQLHLQSVLLSSTPTSHFHWHASDDCHGLSHPTVSGRPHVFRDTPLRLCRQTHPLRYPPDRETTNSMCFAMIDQLGVSKRRKLRARRQWRIHHCSILPLNLAG